MTVHVHVDGAGIEEVHTAVAPKSSKSDDPQLSPIPQSPMPGAVEKPPEFPVSQTSSNSKSPPPENHVASDPLPESKSDTIGPPIPKPRTKVSPIVPRKVSSSDNPRVEPRVNNPQSQNETDRLSSASTNGAPRSAPTSPSRSTSREESPKPTELPPIPPKKVATLKQIIIPKEDVVFELENVPMPGTTAGNTVPVKDRTNGDEGTSVSPQLSAPTLPPKDSGPPSFAPPPPPPERKYFKTVSEPDASAPPVPQRKVTPPPPDFLPPPLPPQDMQEVPSPPPRTTPPLVNQERDGVTSPMAPMVELTEKTVTDNVSETDIPSLPVDIQNGFVESTNQLPPLPPKETLLPPPPPPITPEDYPQDSLESCSDSDSEEDRQFISIQSIKSTGGDILSVAHNPTSINVDDDEYSSSSVGTSSAGQTPVHQPMVIRQQLVGLKSGANANEADDLMMVISPTLGDSKEQEDDAYMNQDIIDQVLDEDEEFDERIFHEPLTVKGSGPLSNDLELKVHDSEGVDYMNQEAIDQAMDDEDEEEIERYTEPVRIQASSPIKSRTMERQRNLDKDYENQDVLDGDIIPFVTLPSSGFPADPMNWQSRQHSDSTPAVLNTPGTSASPDYDILPPRSYTLNFDGHDNPKFPAVGVSEPTADNPPPPDPVSRESSVGVEDSQRLTLSTQNGKQPLEARDSLSGTFPRMKVAVQFGSDTYTSDSNSSIATTPGSLDFDSSYSLSVEPTSFMGGSAPKSNEDFFDGVSS